MEAERGADDTIVAAILHTKILGHNKTTMDKA